MKKICIVQGGHFLLGITQEDVIAHAAWAETAPQAQDKDKRMFHLEAFLSRQIAQTVSAQAVCLELRHQEDDRLFLVADRLVADEAEVGESISPLPRSCPALTVKLCPQVLIWQEMPILLLEPRQVLSVAAELGQDIGVLPPPFSEEPISSAAARASEADKERSALQETLTEAAAAKANQEARKKEAAAIDEAVLKPVISWTIARFKEQCGKGKHEELRLTMDQLPSELIEMIKGKGLDNKVIEYLMEQIVLRCKASMCCKKKKGNSHAG